MKVSELIEKLERCDRDSEVILGVEGYSSTDSEIGVYDNGDYVMVCDGCYYEEVDG